MAIYFGAIKNNRSFARNIAATCKTLGLEGLVQHKYIKRKFQPDLENLKSFIEKLNDQDFQIELQSIKSFYSRLMDITLMLMETLYLRSS